MSDNIEEFVEEHGVEATDIVDALDVDVEQLTDGRVSRDRKPPNVDIESIVSGLSVDALADMNDNVAELLEDDDDSDDDEYTVSMDHRSWSPDD